MAIKDDERH